MRKVFTFLLALASSVGMMNAAVDGKLPGAFTINAGGDQVYFSQGNLQYQASTNTWRFAEHQYDFIGDKAGNNTESGRDAQSDWIDLFGWATSGNSASGTAYQPWQSSTTDSEYGPAITSGEWTYANSDWGINPISNGGNVANSWRTLTQAEWDYILNGRATEYRFCYAKLSIGSGLGYGLIILPDDWDPSYYALSAGSMNQGNHSYDSNEIPAEDWTNSLEAHGAVFLPVTGVRVNGNVVTGLEPDDKIGLYWSSIAAENHYVIEEPEPMQVDIVNAAYNLAFNGGWYIRANQVTTRSRGLAVRLVYTEPSGDPTPMADLSKNIAIDLRNQQLGGTGSEGGSKYLIIDSEDNYTYVDDEPAAYNAYLAFDNFNGSQHGYTNLLITVPAEAGNYLLTLGGCQYGNGAGTVKNAASEILANFTQKTAGCFSGNPAQNAVSLIFTVDAAQNITIDCGNYTPYFAIKKMAAVPAFTDFEINFQTNPCTGKPANVDIAGTYNDNLHGYQNVVATVPVKAGNYRLTLGACEFGNGAGNVMSETNVELASFNQNLGAGNCYHNNTANNIVVANFTVDIDQTITIDCGQYTPYMKLERIKEIPAFKDFAIDLRDHQLGGDGSTGGAKYLTIDGDDYSYVDAEPEAYNAYFQFQNFNGSQHGYTNLLATVPMKAGDYRLTLGTCQYGTGTGNVKTAADAILAEFDQKTAACYNGNPAENVIVVNFTVAEDQLITIDCGNYTPYIKLERIKEIPAFTDFAIDLRDHQLGGDGETAGAKYLTIDGDDYSYVDAEPEAYNAYFQFQNFNGSQHGYFNLLATVPMKAGDYRLTLGTCQYGTGNGNVKSAADAILANFNQNTGACYHNNTAENVIVVDFTVEEDQLITIDCGNYTPYIALAKYVAPSAPELINVEPNQDPQNAGVYYSTFYFSSAKYKLPAGVEAYVADLSGSDLVLTKIAEAGQTIPADNAVIFKANSDNFTLTLSDEEPVSVTTNNDLKGVDEVTAAPENCYVLSGTVQDGVGFYQINSPNLKAHKAYVIYNGSAAPKRMRFVFDAATGMESIQPSAISNQKVIENGVLYIIRDGVRYNVQGQIVK